MAVKQTYNAQQLEIQRITELAPTQHLAVTAGPGTGKTTSLILRMQTLHAVGVPLSEIACITFTKASTQELIHRTPLDGITIQTFHSFLLHLLRMQANAPAFRLISENAWETYLKQVVLSAHTLHRPLKQIYEPHLQQLVEEVITRNHHWILDPPEDPIIKWISYVLRDYYLNHPCPTISLHDLEVFFYLKLTQGRLAYFPYTQLLVDEFQDTSRIQRDIYMAYLTHVNQLTLFIVGDAKQSIYAFRKADAKNFDTMKLLLANTGGQTITLRQNYRSDTSVLKIANAFQDEFLSTQDPHLNSEIASSSHIYCHKFSSSDDLLSQLNRIAQHTIDQGDETAFLFRTTAKLKLFTNLLPTKLQGYTQSSLDNRTEVHTWPFVRSLIYGYLATLFPDVELYHHAWIHSPWKPKTRLPYFSLYAPITLHALQKSAARYPENIEEQLLCQRINQTIEEGARLFLPDYPYKLEAYLLSLINPLKPKHIAIPDERRKNTQPLKLTTLHSSKGLEFHRVVIPLFKDAFPRIQRYPLILEHENQWALRFRHTVASWTEYELYETLKKQYKSEHLAEELRLLYVGITRAQKELHICYIPEETPKLLSDWLDQYSHTSRDSIKEKFVNSPVFS